MNGNKNKKNERLKSELDILKRTYIKRNSELEKLINYFTWQN